MVVMDQNQTKIETTLVKIKNCNTYLLAELGSSGFPFMH